MTATFAPLPIFNISSFSMDRHSSPQPFAAYYCMERSASPCEDTSIQDLSDALSAHTLRSQRSFQRVAQPERSTAQEAIFDEAPIFTIPDYSAPATLTSPVDSAYSSTRSNSIISCQMACEPAKGPRRSYSTSDVRRQRQRALRTQCSSDHLKEVSALVARMVAKGDQCNICDSRVSELADGAAGSDCGDEHHHEDMTMDGDDYHISRPGSSGCDSGRRRPSFRGLRIGEARSAHSCTAKDSGIRKSQQQRRKRTKS